MGSILTNGVFLPAEGERNCYEGLAANWVALDGMIGGYSAHAADLTIHVTAADKEAWNGKADASALTAHTGNTTIHVTAADKQTWDTVTTKANDANAVHKSGNETVGGAKTFSDNLTIYNSDDTQTPKGLTIRNAQWGMGESGGTTVSNINFLDKNSAIPASIIASKGVSGQSFLRFSVRTKDSQNNTYAEEIYYNVDTSGNVSFRPWHDDTVNLGVSIYKWKDVQTKLINGLTPSSLSLPVIDRTKYVDISGYFTNTGNGNINTYSVTANGWVFLRLTNIGGCQLSVLDSSNNRLYGSTSSGNLEQLCLPVTAGTVVETQWTTSTSVTVNIARFIPCQGNI